VSEWNYIVGAYALTWIALAGYAVLLATRLRRAARELARVEAAESSEVKV
jgi:CcmD family protein